MLFIVLGIPWVRFIDSSSAERTGTATIILCNIKIQQLMNEITQTSQLIVHPFHMRVIKQEKQLKLDKLLLLTFYKKKIQLPNS